jgi:ABC-type Na+ transport system ATPase subunit NatA
MGGSGGGVSGEVSFPAYIEAIHEDWLYGAGPSNLTTTVEDSMDTAFGADPYASYSFTNPTTDVAVTQGDYDTYYSAVSASVTTTDFKDLLDFAQARADLCDIDNPLDVRTIIGRQIQLATSSLQEAVDIARSLVDSSVIENLVDTFESEQSRNRERRVGRFMSVMSDVGAMRSSALLTGLGSIYAQEQEDTDRFTKEVSARLFEAGIQAWVQNYSGGMQVDAAISRTNKQSRQATLLGGLQTLAQFYQQRVGWLAQGVQLQAEINRLKYIQFKEYETAELELDVRSALWDMEIFGRGTSIIGGLSGYAHPLPEGPSKLQSVLGGAAGGAAVGSAFGPLGTAIGAGVGGLLGLFS